jgi:hypothetical protein
MRFIYFLLPLISLFAAGCETSKRHESKANDDFSANSGAFQERQLVESELENLITFEHRPTEECPTASFANGVFFIGDLTNKGMAKKIDFRLTNDSLESVGISETSQSCSCTNINIKNERIEPGQRREFEVFVTGGPSGPGGATILLHFDSPRIFHKSLKLHWRSKSSVAFAVEEVDLGDVELKDFRQFELPLVWNIDDQPGESELVVKTSDPCILANVSMDCSKVNCTITVPSHDIAGCIVSLWKKKGEVLCQAAVHWTLKDDRNFLVDKIVFGSINSESSKDFSVRVTDKVLAEFDELQMAYEGPGSIQVIGTSGSELNLRYTAPLVESALEVNSRLTFSSSSLAPIVLQVIGRVVSGERK